jgi:hypothetical protein
MTDISPERIAMVLHAAYAAAPFADNEAGIPEMCELIRALKADNERLRKALKPFANYAALPGFSKIPPDADITQGSRFVVRQVTALDFTNARAALTPKDTDNA